MADFVDPYAAPAAAGAPQGGAPDNSGFVDPYAPPQPATLVGPQRSAIGEVGSAFARGALVDLPTLVGQAGQFVAPAGSGINNAAAGMVSSAAARGQQSWLTLNPQAHGTVVNALAQGAEAVPSLAAPLVAGAAATAALPVELPGLALGAGALAGGALFGAQAGTQTTQAAQAKGLSQADATAAGRLNAATTFATQVGLGLVGGRVLGAAGGAIGRAVGFDGAQMAGDILDNLTGQGSVVGSTLKAAGIGAAESVGVGAAQSAATAAINNAYGIDDTSPLQAAAESIGPMLGMTAVLTPFGLAGRALAARGAMKRTAQLAHPDTSPGIRTQLADQYASAIETQSGDANAAREFSTNAQRAIDQGLPLDVSAEMFNPGAVKPASQNNPLANAAVNGPLQIENNPTPASMVANSRGLVQHEGDTFTFPDGSTTKDINQVQSFIDAQARAQIQPDNTPRLPYNAPPEDIDRMVADSNGNVAKVGDSYTFPDGSTSKDVNDVRDYFTRQQAEQTQNPEMLQLLHNPTPPEVEQMVATSDGLVQKKGDSYTFPDGSSTADIRQVQSFFADKAERDAARAADPTLPKSSDDIASDIVTANKVITGSDDIKAQQRVPVQKQLDAIGIDKLDTHDAQIDALTARLADPDVKIGVPTRDRLNAMLDQWKQQRDANTPEPAPAEATPALSANPPSALDALGENVPASVGDNAPAQAESLGTNIPVAAPDNTSPPTQADTLGENVEQSPQSHAQDTADMVDTALAGMNSRVRNGEQLTPLEQERMEDLQGFRQTLGEINSGNNASDDYTQSVSDMAREAAQKPYTESYRRYVVGNPEATDPGIMLDSLRTGKLGDTLNTIAQNGSTPEVKALAEKLAPLVPDTTLKYAAPDGTGSVGEYQPAANHVNIFPGGESEATILHESVHAATQAAISKAETIGAPHTQDEALLKKAYSTIEGIRQEVIRRLPDSSAYGLANAHEFVAELHSNPEFQQELRNAQEAPGKPSLWSRAVNAVKGLLGLKGPEGNFLNDAMKASETFFDKNRAGFPLPAGSDEASLFRKSPGDAAKVTDDEFSKMAGMVKGLGKIDMGKVGLATYRAALPLVTKQYIVDRIAALPAMVKSGFAKAIADHLAVDELKHAVTATIEDPVVKYVTGAKEAINRAAGGDSDKARDLSHTMTVIGHEASRGEFDYKKNFADNVAAGRQLEPRNKAYVDDIYRMYTQLKSTNPDLAKALDDGALQSSRSNAIKVANIVRNVVNASKDPLMAKHAAALDIMDKGLKSARNPDAARFADGMHAELDRRLNAAFSDATQPGVQGVLKNQIGEMRELYNAQKANPYFSLGRSGDYFTSLHFQNMDAATMAKLQDIARPYGKVLGNLMGGDTHAFFRLDTLDAATGLYNRLLQAAGDKVVPDSGARGKLADRVDSAHGVSPALRQVLQSLHETVGQMGLDPAAEQGVRDTMTRELMSLLPETSSRSAIMPRKGIPGYDADFLGNFAARASGGVHDSANMYMNPQYAAARSGMSDAIEKMARGGSTPEMQTRAQMAADEVNKRYANSQNPLDNKAVNLINSLGHTFYLAASPAYLIRTMAQPFHRGLPIVGARFGFVPAAKAMAGAQATAMKIMVNTIREGRSANGLRGVLDANTSFRNLGLPPSEEAFIQTLHDRGLLNLGQARQLQSMALGGTQLQQDIARMASMTAQYAEMGNRLSMALGAFRTAESRGNAGADPAKTAANTEWAIQATNRAMDNFDPTNTARAIGKYGFAKGATPLLTAFMNYNLQTMQQIARTVHDGLFNQDQSAEGRQRSIEAKKELAGLMGTTAMISGAMGLPFANVFAGVYNTLTNDNNDPSDIRVDVQNWLDRNLGHTLGGAVAHGIPHALGADSSTFGLENLLPGSEFLASRQLLKDRLGDQSTALMGPALNAGVNIISSMDKFSDGFYTKGIEEALPSGLKPYFKAAELATRGYTDSKENPQAMNPVTPDNPLGNKATWGQIALQATGFRSARAADVNEAQQFASARQDRLDFQRGLVEDQFYKGALGDQGAAAGALQGLQTFNAANPTQRISNVGEAVRQRMVSLALAGITGTGVAASNPRQALTLGQQLMFATDNQDSNRAMP
jgi:hypothetical protein